MAKQTFRAGGFTGLNKQADPAKLETTELQEALNVDFSEVGAVKPVKDNLLVYSQAGTPRGIFPVRYGDTDHIIYKVDQSVYEDGSLLWDSGNDNDIRVLADAKFAYIFDGSETRVWDGTFWRVHGMPTADIINQSNRSVVVDFHPTTRVISIVNVHLESPCRIEATAHGFSTGDRVYIDEVVGTTELNGTTYTVTEGADANHLTLDGVDAVGFTAYSSAGRLVENGCGLVGAYMYRVVYIAVLADGTEIKSDPAIIPFHIYTDYLDQATLAGDHRVFPYFRKFNAAQVTAWTNGTLETDVTFKAELYRTKADGASYYLLEEYDHDDTYDASGTTTQHQDTTRDQDLGALLLFDPDTHGVPPAGTDAAFCQQRMFVVDADNQDRLYKSEVEGYEYYKPSGWNKFDGNITALGVHDDTVLVLGPRRPVRFNPYDEIGHKEDIDIQVGAVEAKAVVDTPYGLLLANDRGLWSWDGAGISEVSFPLLTEWEAEAGDWRGTYGDNKAYFCQGTASTEYCYVMNRLGTENRWSQQNLDTGGNMLYLGANHDTSIIYGLSTLGVYKIHGSSTNATMTIQTKDFGGEGGIYRGYEVWVDVNGSVTVTVKTNRDTTGSSVAVSTTSRQPVRNDLPTSLVGEYWSIEVSGTGAVYDAWVVVAT